MVEMRAASSISKISIARLGEVAVFAYIVILLEILILASVFWYVFVRQPKPIDYSDFFPKGRDPWGTYDRRASRR